MINFEEFKRVLEEIKAAKDFQYELYSEYDIENKMIIDTTVRLLSKLVNDVNGWIDVWVHGLDCGSYENSFVNTPSGKVSINTIEDVWNLILTNQN